jgi:DNA ligase (NAD+)
MTELENNIVFAQQKYYDGEPVISDEEFDLLWDMLKIQQPDSSLLKSIGSDTSIFPKANHLMMMGSQNKAKNEAEFRKWFSKQNSKSFIVQYKLDGASLEAQYKDGKLVKAVTRGNGSVGDDITPNAIKFIGLPKEVDPSFTGAVRGEVLMFKSDRTKYFPDMANCRNGAVGTMKQKDGAGCEHLHFISYDVYNYQCNTESEKISFLIDNGFEPVYYHTFTDVDNIIKFRNDTNNSRNDLEYDIDGIVIKCINVDEKDLLRDRPEHQIAFKFELEYADTELVEVEFRQNGKTFTPVAHVRPVQLCGTTVKQASFHNMDILDDFIKRGLMIGSIVRIVKRGEIIPYVEEVMG